MKRRATAAATAAVMLGATVTAGPALAQEVEPERVTVLVEDLAEPRGVGSDGDGNVYVAEAGTGGEDFCLEIEDEETGDTEQLCIGRTSQVTRVAADGEVERGWLSGLPSLGVPGGEHVGVSSVAVADDGTVYVTFGLGASAAERDAVAEAFEDAALFGTLQRVEEDGTLTEVADLAQYEDDNNPDGNEEGPDSNPNDLVIVGDTIYVVDAGGNTLLAVDRATGDIELVTVFSARTAPVPPFLGGDGQMMMPMESVPTSVTVGPDGTLLVGELTGFPFPVGGANVWEVDPASDEAVVAFAGLTAVTGVAMRGDDVFAVQLARAGLLGAEDDPSGSIARLAPNGARFDLLDETFVLPYGIVSDGDVLYVSAGTILPDGWLVRVDPSLAGDPAIQPACPPDEVVAAGFTDIATNVHAEAALCMAWHDVFRGFDDGTFRPRNPITRGQFASTVARMVTATGTDLPPPTADFPDIGASVHEDAIRRLATGEVIQGFADGTFRPGASITRAQAVSMMVRAFELVGDPLPDPTAPSPFTDVPAANVHATAIAQAAEADWIAGVTPTQFAPTRTITRGQTASVLARFASTLVTNGTLELPSD